MERFARAAMEFLKNEDGPTAVEYAVLGALIIVACTASITVIGSKTNSMYNAPVLQNALSS